jgi:hypothetical protein
MLVVGIGAGEADLGRFGHIFDGCIKSCHHAFGRLAVVADARRNLAVVQHATQLDALGFVGNPAHLATGDQLADGGISGSSKISMSSTTLVSRIMGRGNGPS